MARAIPSRGRVGLGHEHPCAPLQRPAHAFEVGRAGQVVALLCVGALRGERDRAEDRQVAPDLGGCDRTRLRAERLLRLDPRKRAARRRRAQAAEREVRSAHADTLQQRFGVRVNRRPGRRQDDFGVGHWARHGGALLYVDRVGTPANVTRKDLLKRLRTKKPQPPPSS